MTRPPLRLLIITPLDWQLQANNIEHNRVREYRARGVDVCVLSKVMNQSKRWSDLALDTLTLRLRELPNGPGEEGARIIAVDPFFNYFAGLRKNTEELGPAALSGSDSSSKPGWRARGVRWLAPLAILRDICFVPCFAFASLWKFRGRFDACLGVGPFGAMTGWVLRGLGRTKILVCEDHDYEPGLVPPGLRRKLFAALDRFTLRRGDLVVSIGHLLAAERRAQLGCDARVLPSGVEWAKFEPARARASTAAGAQSALRLIYVGNVVSWSGLELALAALAELPEASLTVVGEGLPGYMLQLAERAAVLKVAERVEFLGRRASEELPELLGQAHIGLANSEPNEYRRFASPLKVMEYMAAGLPVITTEATEAAEIVTRASAGLAVPYAVGPLVAALAELSSQPERRAQLSAGGVEFARTVDWGVLVEREQAWIEECLL